MIRAKRQLAEYRREMRARHGRETKVRRVSDRMVTCPTGERVRRIELSRTGYRTKVVDMVIFTDGTFSVR